MNRRGYDILSLVSFPFFYLHAQKLRGHKWQYHDKPCALYPLYLSHPRTKQALTNWSPLYYIDAKLPPSAVSHGMYAEEWDDWFLLWKGGLCSARCRHNRGVSRGITGSQKATSLSLLSLSKRGWWVSFIPLRHHSKMIPENSAPASLPHPQFLDMAVFLELGGWYVNATLGDIMTNCMNGNVMV